MHLRTPAAGLLALDETSSRARAVVVRSLRPAQTTGKKRRMCYRFGTREGPWELVKTRRDKGRAVSARRRAPRTVDAPDWLGQAPAERDPEPMPDPL